MYRSTVGRRWPVAVALTVTIGLLATMAVDQVAIRPAEAADAPADAPAGFVYRQGRSLMLDGRPYRYVGFNAYGMSGCATGQPWDQEQLDDYFAGLRPVSVTRTWAFESRGLAELDRIVAAAEAHNQKLILPLANAGADCDRITKDNDWYSSGYRSDSYLPWVRTVVSRYADSPAVAMWEIMNEPGNLASVDDVTMKAFFDDVAATIKSYDPHHLVGTGSMAEYTSGTRNFGFVHSGPDIDVGSLHEYDYDPASDTLLHSYFSRHLAPTLHAMYQQGKPLIVGETGIPVGAACPRPAATTLRERADGFRQKFDGYLLHGVAGALVWNYTPNPGSDNCERVRGTPPDPTIAMVRDYRMPVPVTPPATSGALVVRSSGKCLNVPNGVTANGAQVEQVACNGAAHQRFSLQTTEGGFYQILAQHSGKCFDVAGQSLLDKARIVQWDCWGGANQQFRLMPTGDGYYHVLVRSSVKCLNMTGGTVDRSPLQQYTCYGTPNVQFKIQP